MIAMSNSSQVLIRSLYNRLARVVGLGLAAGTLTGSSGLAQMSSPGFHTAEALSACPEPALSRVFQHRVAEGDTLESIAQQYNLIPDTIRGFNPSLQSGRLAVGQELNDSPFQWHSRHRTPGANLAGCGPSLQPSGRCLI